MARELKQNIPTETLKKIRPLLATYGGRKILADKAKIDYAHLRDVKKLKTALPSVIKALAKVEI